mmetsp:Transcript_4902/g.10818  ORF Transcript_4902/g.10818 Transcript_4902/m.10818 type:complete len:249 (+) Transcript_4902:213-959(+)
MSQTTAKRTALRSTSIGCYILKWIVHNHQHGWNPLMCFLQQVFQIKECRLLATLVDECCCNSSLSTTSRTSDTMHVIFNFTRHVKVNDVLYISKVQTLGCDISSDEHVLLPRLVQRNGFISLLLILPSVDTHGLHSLEQQVLMNIIHISLLLTKDNHGRSSLLQTLEQIHNLRLLLDIFHLLNHIQVRSTRSTHIDHHRTYQSLLCKVLKLLWKRGRVQNCLTLVVEVIHYLSDLLVKSQVKHAICLV